MKTLTLKNGVTVPRLGMGSWFIGDNRAARKEEIETLRRGVDLGMTLIDTAEMYGGGRSEELVGEAIAPYDREKLFLVSKVLPNNAGRRNIFRSCENSMRRLRTDYLDCYLLHWRGGVSLEETVECMMELVGAGKIKSFGVSNLDSHDMRELFSVTDGENCVIDQVLYHLASRGVEYDLLQWLKNERTAMMAYCPLAQAGRLGARGLLRGGVVSAVAEKHGADSVQVLLAFSMRDENIIAIPKASSLAHVESNFQSLEIALDDEDIALLSKEFPPPDRKMPLDIQ